MMDEKAWAMDYYSLQGTGKKWTGLPRSLMMTEANLLDNHIHLHLHERVHGRRSHFWRGIKEKTFSRFLRGVLRKNESEG